MELVSFTDVSTTASVADIGHHAFIILHPFASPGNGYLSFPNAIESLRPLIKSDALVLAICDNQLLGFADKLRQFSDQGGPAELSLLAKRAKALATVEQDKWQLPTPSITPAFWQPQKATQALPHLNAAANQYRTIQATQDAANAIADIDSELTALKQRKQAQTAPQAPTQPTVAVWGQVVSQGDQLNGGPGHEMTYTTMMAFTGDLDRLNQWVGL